MADIDMRFTPRIVIGSSVRLEADTGSWGDRALIIADSILEKEALSIQAQLDDLGVKAILFARDGLGCHSESLDEALSLARGSHAGMVVSLGGEKVLSLGRLVSAITTTRNYASDALSSGRVIGAGLPIVELPSSGRHSLLFRREAVLGDSNGNRSTMVELQAPVSHTVILDSALTGRTPQAVSELSAAVRLGTAIESFLSPRSTALSEVQARAAVTSASDLLKRVRSEADHPDYRTSEIDSLLFSAFSTGLTGVAPGQALAWASAWASGISRASAYSVLLPWVLESPLYAGSPRAVELASLMAPDETGGNPADEVRSLFGRLGLAGRLREVGADLGDMIPAAGWAAGMAGSDRADFDETAFRDILEIAS